MEPFVTTTSLVQIGRHEIQTGLGGPQVEIANVGAKVDTRLVEMEGVLKQQDAKILPLEKLLGGNDSNASTPRSCHETQKKSCHETQKRAGHEQQPAELKTKIESMTFALFHGDAQGDASKIMALRGLESLRKQQNSCRTNWRTFMPRHMYIKSTSFDGLLFAKFRNADATGPSRTNSVLLMVGKRLTTDDENNHWTSIIVASLSPELHRAHRHSFSPSCFVFFGPWPLGHQGAKSCDTEGRVS